MPKPSYRHLNRPWGTKEWKQKQSDRVSGQKCQQCGSTDVLQVHHNSTDKKLYYIMQKRVIRQLIADKMQNGEIPFKGIQIKSIKCPSCDQSLIISNSRLKNIKCQKCGLQFQIEKEKIIVEREYNFNLSRSEMVLFIRRFEAEIDAIMKDKGAPPKPDYMDLTQDTIVLCKTCHYALENGHDICPKCKKNYKKIGDLDCSSCRGEIL
jgi:translation initiation factor 2 beta subunit (eIF-2beta)/eIF-5